MSAAAIVVPHLVAPGETGLVYQPGAVATDFDTLAEQFAPLCRTAVDPLEIAAVLESSGLNDARAREMGRADVFAVADDMWNATSRQPPMSTGHRRLKVELSHHAVRGTLYMLPAVVASALFSRDTDVGGGALLLTALVVGWSASQAVAYCAYVCLGRGRPAAAARLLLGAVVVAVAATAAAAALWTAAPLPAAGAAWIAAAELSYFLAATALFVLGRDRLLLLAMAPLGVVCIAAVVSSQVPAAVLAVTAGVTLVGVGALAIAVAFRASRLGEVGGTLTRQDLVAAVPDAVLGAALALWLVWSAVDRVHAGGAGSAFLAPATIPVVLGAALAEWRISRYRAAIDDLLRTVDVVDRFRHLSARLLRRLLVEFAATLALVALVVLVLRTVLADRSDVVVVEHAGMTVLGFVFFLSSLLAGFGSAAIAAYVVVGTGATAVATQLLLAPDSPTAIWFVFLVAGLVVVAILVRAAERRLTQPRSHR